MVNLTEIAKQAMLERGFIPEFPREVIEELSSIQNPATPGFSISDMRDRLWISIDNDDSLDLDQLTLAEKQSSGKNKIFVAIADVDSLVKYQSAIDKQAAFNTTSVYTPTKNFPMLPLKLSTDLTSLNENVDRCAIVVEIEVNNDGYFELTKIYPCLVRNHAKLTYHAVGSFLEEKTPLTSPYNIPDITDQLLLQDSIAQRINDFRFRQGALSFARTEVKPVIVNEQVVELQEKKFNRAHSLIENFMIAANSCSTRYLAIKNLSSLKRIVKTPKRWDRIVFLAKNLGETLPDQPDGKALQEFLSKQHFKDPEHFQDLSLAIIKLIGRGEYVLGTPEQTQGHFDLALQDYSHMTAPNRRFPDLVMQRLLKCSFSGSRPIYTDEALSKIALHCTQKEDDASKVERRLIKCAAAMVLQNQIGKQFNAMITGSSEKGTWVRLKNPPLEGKLISGLQDMDVGDYLTVKLKHVDVINGHIDFIRD